MHEPRTDGFGKLGGPGTDSSGQLAPYMARVQGPSGACAGALIAPGCAPARVHAWAASAAHAAHAAHTLRRGSAYGAPHAGLSPQACLLPHGPAVPHTSPAATC